MKDREFTWIIKSIVENHTEAFELYYELKAFVNEVKPNSCSDTDIDADFFIENQ